MYKLKHRRVRRRGSDESDDSQDGGQDFFHEIVERMRKDINHTNHAVNNAVRGYVKGGPHSGIAPPVSHNSLRNQTNNNRQNIRQRFADFATQRGRRMLINWEYKTPFVFTTQNPAPEGAILEDDVCDTDQWNDDLSNLSTPTDNMAPPLSLFSRRSSRKSEPLTLPSSTINYQSPLTSSLSTKNNQSPLISSSSTTTNNQSENNNNYPRDTNQQIVASPISPVNNNSCKRHASTLECDNLNHNVNAADDNNTMGNTFDGDSTSAANNNINFRIHDTTTQTAMKRMSVKAILVGQHRSLKDSSGRSSEESPTAVPGLDCDIFENQSNNHMEQCYKPGSFSSRGMDGMETRRRNFSSSSLPLSLMTATIEEADDAEYMGISGSHKQNTTRSHSYVESITSSAKIPFRALRRDARIPSTNSPPRARRPGPITGLVRSASDQIDRVASLREVDIIGESFESRFPWQRDFGVQCEMPADVDLHPSLERAMSGPAVYTYFRSLSLTSNSPVSSPPLTSRDLTFHRFSRSCSQCDLAHHHHAFNVGDTTASYHHRHAAINRSNSTNCSNCEGARYGVSYSNRRADFKRRPRPSSLGAADTIRYHHELTKFRELHNSKLERKSDPQLVLSPSGCRKMALFLADDTGSVSDLESILENPGDRPWDISRQTSMASFDLEDDVIRFQDVADHHEHLEYHSDYTMRGDVLPSPPLSPRMWATFHDDEYIDDSDDSLNNSDDQVAGVQRRVNRGQQPRRLSSGSITSDAESESTEPDPQAARRGRRSAIYETKNCGDVSPTTLSPEASPSNSCDEGEGASNIAERLRRRRSSVDLAMNIYPGDLLVQEHHKKLIKRNTIADFYAGRQPNGSPLPPGVAPAAENVDVIKKGRQSFSLLKLMKTRSKESLTKLGEILRRLKPSEFKDNHLAAYKSLHWSDLIASTDKQQTCQTTTLSDTERKRREAVWELFKSECVFLIDHLMVLKHCFMEPLKKVQVEGSLMYAEPQDLFGNLDELSYVSYTFCKDFIAALLKDMSITDFGRTNVLLKAFQRFSAHSRDGAVYHSYCLNYTSALTYLDKLRANSEFAEFEKWCEQDPRCKRLQLTDLLVAPMQHCTKLPLLLHNVRKYTANEDERQHVAESIEKVEASLKQLEEKMRWIKNFERVQEIQRQIVWPAVTELDPRCVIPESLKASLSKQPCEKLLACPTRQLLHEGQVTLVETPKPIDVHLFLFDDILLITKVKKVPRKMKQLNTDTQSSGQSDRVSYIVLRQPLALDRFMLHDISSSDAAASGLKHCFALVHISRYQQITGVFTFQADSDAAKTTWLYQIREAMDAYHRIASCPSGSFKENPDLKAEEKEAARSRERRGESQFACPPRRLQNGHSNSVRSVPTKSRSMDAVFI